MNYPWYQQDLLNELLQLGLRLRRDADQEVFATSRGVDLQHVRHSGKGRHDRRESTLLYFEANECLGRYPRPGQIEFGSVTGE
ncbi:hypothetical protein BN000_04121 [Mycobacterium europaeum]|uniref:Uncharacterized protein n=1 Tax=Mycobacterium europaeum TaxID=761804 RepID=A0A0U1DM57_9MYCO|nr:hypothetical protein BN000_04121 [Mycobacterium europaeum]